MTQTLDDAVAIGTVAPDFELPDQDRRPVRLSDFRGRHVVLVFYPFAFTRVCGGELHAIRDALADLQNADSQVLAVSVDSVHVHRAWVEQEGFGFPMLADFWPHGEVARAYGVLDAEVGAAVRGTFIIDRQGIVRWRVVNPIPDARDVDTYRRVLAEL